MFKALASLALLASAAVAQLPNSNRTDANVTIAFTNPVSGTNWTYSENQTITWTAPIASDPQNVSLLLINVYNQTILPFYPTPLALNIYSNLTEFALTNVSIPVGQGYVVIMTDIYNSSNIYAQGGFFNVTASETPAGEQGSGFSVASSTTIMSGGPAGGVMSMTESSAPRSTAARFARERRVIAN